MAKIKPFETSKTCMIQTPTDCYWQIFDSSWSYKDIKAWMFDTFCIDEDSILELKITSETRYKLPSND